MRLSELQNKDVILESDGKLLGKIIDIVINSEGIIEKLVVEKYKFLISRFKTSGEIEIPWKNISKMGEDVILVSYI